MARTPLEYRLQAEKARALSRATLDALTEKALQAFADECDKAAKELEAQNAQGDMPKVK